MSCQTYRTQTAGQRDKLKPFWSTSLHQFPYDAEKEPLRYIQQNYAHFRLYSRGVGGGLLWSVAVLRPEKFKQMLTYAYTLQS